VQKFKRENENKLLSYWFCFVSSLDRPTDISLIKELLFWAYIYHRDDSKLYILIPGLTQKDYEVYRTIFKISEVPELVFTDSETYPIDYVKFNSNFFTSKLVGDDYKKLRDTMDSLHNTLQNTGSLRKVKTRVIKQKLTTSLARSWGEIKSLISINLR
jgi:hypothetical protein